MELQVQQSVTLNAFREAFESQPRTIVQHKAFQEFCKVGLPSAKSEEYRFTPIGKYLEANFDLSLYGQCVESELRNEINENEISIHIINGKVEFDNNQILNTGIEIGLREVIPSPENKDPFVLLNTAFASQEVYIRINDNIKIDKPINISHIIDSEAEQVLQNTRMVIELCANASCNITETFQSSGINPVFSNVFSEYIIHENAYLNYYRIQNDAGAFQVYTSTVKQLGKSVINSFVFTFDGNVVRNNSIFSIEAEHCESNFYGLYLPSGKSLIDNHTVADHKVANCVSNELYKGIVNDNARGVFNGKIYVRPDAQKTNAFQSNRNILLTDTATVNTKPQLEIWADDVKCSHGCTTGQLDKEALFYLQSRGISLENARTLLLTAFAGEVINKITDKNFRAEIESIINEKLNSPF